ncbi:hypothetical protein A2U01_0106263, partial [Trifolium medium]|nr:hypothetical protein [Trifolium medium]
MAYLAHYTYVLHGIRPLME